MIKMPCLFERDFTNPSKPGLLPVVTPGCEWVQQVGIATRKRDGTACAVIRGKLYRRYDAKHGRQPPQGAIPCSEPDPITGHWPHWLAVDPRRPEDRYHALAWQRTMGLPDGTYELCGPKIGTNAEDLSQHCFFAHGGEKLGLVPLDYEGLREYLGDCVMEGIVFHHPTDGRMAKIRRHDFGWPW